MPTVQLLNGRAGVERSLSVTNIRLLYWRDYWRTTHRAPTHSAHLLTTTCGIIIGLPLLFSFLLSIPSLSWVPSATTRRLGKI